MKVCNKQKLLFIHIPKCGGSSVVKAFDMEQPPSLKLKPHVGVQLAMDRFPEMAQDYLKFAVIRNPWEIEVSSFFYRLSQDCMEAGTSAPHLDAATGGFAGALRDRNVIACFEPNLVRSHKHGRSLMRFLTDKNDNIAVDEVLRLENIDEDMKAMCEKHNLNFVREFKRRNSTNHLHYSQYYTEQWMIDYIYEKNEDYIKHFKYKFEHEDQ